MPTIIFPSNTRPGIQIVTPAGIFVVPPSLELHVSEAAAQWFASRNYTVKLDYMKPAEPAAPAPAAALAKPKRKSAARKTVRKTTPRKTIKKAE